MLNQMDDADANITVRHCFSLPLTYIIEIYTYIPAQTVFVSKCTIVYYLFC